jgi:hypothetical protein
LPAGLKRNKKKKKEKIPVGKGRKTNCWRNSVFVIYKREAVVNASELERKKKLKKEKGMIF